MTVEAVEAGTAVVTGQCKSQILHIPPVLRKELLAYAKRQGIRSGPIFVTRNGSPIKRPNISESIRRLCRDAQVPEEKGNPRCLQKLHQTTYRNIENGVAALIEELWFDGPRAEPSGKDFGSAWGNIESAGGSL